MVQRLILYTPSVNKNSINIISMCTRDEVYIIRFSNTEVSVIPFRGIFTYSHTMVGCIFVLTKYKLIENQ